jgi:hypothetical protein
MTGRVPCIAALALLLALPCGADDSASLVEQVRRHDLKRELRRVGLLGARLSHPQQVVGSVGVMWVHQPPDFDCTTGCDFRGPLVEVEPGLAGMQIGAGYGVLVGDRRLNRFFMRRVFIGWGVKAALLRTWDNSTLDPAQQTFFGVEAQFTITQVNFRLGVMHNSWTEELEDPWLVTAGIGWGF